MNILIYFKGLKYKYHSKGLKILKYVQRLKPTYA